MTSPIAFPDWLPPWAQLLVLIVGILLVLAFLMMPFSVFGLKSRLEGVEARLDEIQGEIRALARTLADSVDPEHALARFDDTMLPVVHHFQATAGKNAEGALPSSHLREVLLGWVLHFMPPSLMAAQFGKQFAVEEKLLHGLV